MSLREGMCALVASAVALVGMPAIATTIVRSRLLEAPECRDPPSADPVLHYESLPTHAQITEYLADDRSRPRYTCSSARLTYAGMRDKSGIRVISRYRAGGGVHAETYSKREDDIGGWRRHGIVRVQRRNGDVQSLEYFCHGFEVGIHRYFDANGELAAVVDYSRSDYEWQKPLDGGRYHDFYVKLGRLGSSTGLERAQRFREVYRVQGEWAERVAFAATDVFHHQWRAIDPASTVRQWTEPGMRGPMSYSGQPTQIRNYDFDYLSFAEVYQRKQLGAPGMRPPRPYHSLLLECPWIDEAMEPGIKDARFSFEPPARYTEKQRAASPQHRFETCLRDPNVSCLLEQALASARYSQPLHGDAMQAFADVALAAGKPALARAAMEEVLADTQGYTFPNPIVARQAAIKAEAEAALGLNDEAKQSADAAFANAMGSNTHAAGKAVHILEEVGPRLARMGAIEKAREAFNEVPVQYAEDALFTLEEIGIAQARQGDVAGARSTIEELAVAGRAAQSGRSDDPFALVELAAGQAERGDLQAAAATLAMIPVVPELTPAQAQQVNAKAAAIRARFPQSRPIAAAIEQALVSADLRDRLAVAAAYCESGNIELGVGTLTRARRVQKQRTPEDFADLGATEARCGRVERALADFRAAREAISKMPPNRIDLIGAGREALLHLTQRMLDAGVLDSLLEVPLDDHQFAIAVALKRAELGDASSAWSTLESIQVPDPMMEQWEFALSLTLARARVLTQLSQNDAAEKEFALARQLALTQNDQLTGAALLVRLAQARLRAGQPEKARATLVEAQAAFLDGLISSHRHFWRGATHRGTSLVRAWAVAGSDADASKLMASMTQLRSRAVAVRALDRINGEIAVSLAGAGKAADSIASLQKVERSSLRAWFLSRLTAIAQYGNDKALLAATADLWRTALDELQQTVEDVNGADERRRLYHAYLVALRMKSPLGTESQRGAALESLRRNLVLFGTDGARARAGCELAFTLQQVGQVAVAAALFAESQEMKIKTSSATRNMPTDKPAPAGACAYWMAAAGRADQGSSVVGEVFEARRDWLSARGNYPKAGAEQVLQELAIVVSESEAGEIDWLTGVRLRQASVSGQDGSSASPRVLDSTTAGKKAENKTITKSPGSRFPSRAPVGR